MGSEPPNKRAKTQERNDILNHINRIMPSGAPPGFGQPYRGQAPAGQAPPWAGQAQLGPGYHGYRIPPLGYQVPGPPAPQAIPAYYLPPPQVQDDPAAVAARMTEMVMFHGGDDIPPARTPESFKQGLYIHQMKALGWMSRQEEGEDKGGILADDMGLGKTISTIALLVSRQSKNAARKPTLIVGPLAIIRQWEEELSDKVHDGDQLSVHIHHQKKKSYEHLARFDVVLTTYGTITAEYKRYNSHMIKYRIDNETAKRDMSMQKTCPILHPLSRWHRVVLDEAQAIKNRQSKSFHATSMINSTYRWCLTGTPMMNSVDEIFPLISFLRIPPYSSYDMFKKAFRLLCTSSSRKHTPSGSQSDKDKSLKLLQDFLSTMMLRRTKATKIDGRPIIELPERQERTMHIEFIDVEEKRAYDALESRNLASFNRYFNAGTVGKNYANILVLILRSRQFVGHPRLAMDMEDAEALNETNLERVRNLPRQVVHMLLPQLHDRAFACSECQDIAMGPVFFTCGHCACPECYMAIVDNHSKSTQDDDDAHRACPEQGCPNTIDVDETFRLSEFVKVYGAEAPQYDPYDPYVKNEPGVKDEPGVKGEPGFKGELGVKDEHTTESEYGIKNDPDAFPVKNEEGDMDVKDEQTDDPYSSPYFTGSRTALNTKSRNPPSYDSEDDSDLDADADLNRALQSRLVASGQNTNSAAIAKAGALAAKAAATSSPPQINLLGEPVKKSSYKEARAKFIAFNESNWQESTKVRSSMDLLNHIMTKSPDDKVLVFSSFIGLLDLLDIAIRRELQPNSDASAKKEKEVKKEAPKQSRITRFLDSDSNVKTKPKPGDNKDKRRFDTADNTFLCRYDGQMTPDERTASLKHFRKSPAARIMLLSLRAGNAGLNLNVANHVIILEPFWNPYIESQAADRCYRIGQKKEVQIYRFIVKGTIEDRISELQERKKELVGSIMEQDGPGKKATLNARELGFLLGRGRLGPR